MKKNQTTSMISSCVVELPIGRFELKGDESYLLSCQKTSKKCSPATTSLLKKASLELKEFFEGNRQTFSIPTVFLRSVTILSLCTIHMHYIFRFKFFGRTRDYFFADRDCRPSSSIDDQHVDSGRYRYLLHVNSGRYFLN